MNKDNINLDDINRITLDLSVPRIVNVRCIQGDSNSRKLIIVLTNDGEFFPVDDSITVEYKLKKPDGKFVDNNVTAIIDGVIYITLSEQAAACAGVVHAELRLSKNLPNESSEDTTSQIISTMPFNIIVEPSVVSNEEIISECESDVINEMITHLKDYNNPHHITKDNIGLGKVENKSSAEIRNEITKSNVTSALGFTPYMPNEIDNKFSALETNIDWKESVPSYKDIASTYPNPQDGWTVNVNDTDYTYRYNGTDWIAISANAIPKATDSVDGLLSKEDHANYNDSNIKKHTHSNKEILDSISSTQISLWNSVNNKVDMIQGKGLSSNDFTTAEKNKLANIPAGIVSGVKGNSESTYRTGNVNLTPANIGLGNVDNTHDKDKNVAYATKAAQDGSGNNIVSTYVKKSGDTMSGTLSSLKATDTYLAGNRGHAIINSTSRGGTYTMLDKLNSTNGYFTDGVYQGRREFHYTAKSVVDAGLNEISSNLVLLDENGNSSFPGNFETYGCVHTMPNDYSGRIQAGDKVKMWTDSEGGNIEITSNTGNTYWQVDALNDVLRIYQHNNSTGANYFPLNINGYTTAIGRLTVSDTINGYNIGGSVSQNNNGLITGGNVYNALGSIQIVEILNTGLLSTGAAVTNGTTATLSTSFSMWPGATNQIVIPTTFRYCDIESISVSGGKLNITVRNTSGASHTLSAMFQIIYYKYK